MSTWFTKSFLKIDTRTTAVRNKILIISFWCSFYPLDFHFQAYSVEENLWFFFFFDVMLWHSKSFILSLNMDTRKNERKKIPCRNVTEIFLNNSNNRILWSRRWVDCVYTWAAIVFVSLAEWWKLRYCCRCLFLWFYSY